MNTIIDITCDTCGKVQAFRTDLAATLAKWTVAEDEPGEQHRHGLCGPCMKAFIDS